MSLRQKALNGAKWSAVSSVMTIGLGILQLALLARMIDPKEFGLLTISLVILTLVDTLLILVYPIQSYNVKICRRQNFPLYTG